MTAKQVVDVLSGVPLTAAQHKTTINSLWERMAGTSNVRVPELLPEMRPELTPKAKLEQQKAQAKEAKTESKAARPTAAEPAAKPPQSSPSEGQLTRPGKPSIVLLPPLTPPVFVKHAAGAPKSQAAAENPPKPAASEPEAGHEVSHDLVKSDPAHASPPEPGGAPMAPRASAHEEMEEGEESEYSDENPADSDEVSGQSEDDTADQKAKAAARLGKKLRRKALAKERPPAEA
jgi:hypothetical protein